MTPPLFGRLLGPGFDRLAPRVRQLHALDGPSTWRGECSIARGRHPLARLCAAVARLPPEGTAIPVTVSFSAERDGETWRRCFGSHRMHSRLHAADGVLRERLGPLLFEFVLAVRDGGIHWQARALRLFGVLPLPARLVAGVQCREHEQEGRYRFLVEACLPLAGRLIRYEGWLEHA